MSGPDRDRITLATPRLLLRPVMAADAGPTAALVTPDVSANLLTWPSPMSVAQAEARIAESTALSAQREEIDFAILLKQSGALAGWIGLKVHDGGPPRLGYWLGTGFRGAGLMKEAAACAVPAGAEFLKATAVDALVFPENAPSIAVLRSVGFAPVPDGGMDFDVAGGARHAHRYRRELAPGP